MKAKTIQRLLWPLVVGLGALWLIGHGVGLAQAPAALTAIQRLEDPVVVTGAHFPGFAGVPLDELVLYAYRSGVWTPIPFQIDEVSITGTYVISDGGLLDDNDQLVFMPFDAGTSISATVWPSDTQSRLHARYVISVADPLNLGSTAYAYVYRSTTLARSNASYVTWDYDKQTATTISYTAAFSPSKFIGLADLKINGSSVDALDRQKIRGTILGLIRFDEETLTSFGAPTLTLPAAGPVRAAANDGDLNVAFYRSRLEFDVAFDLSVLSPDFIRTSFDWNNPITTGITTYRDSNTPAGVTINGVPDSVATTPPIDWFQVNGGAGGPGGMVFAILNIDPSGGALTNYYKDNSAIDPDDKGDQRSYGDAGVRVDNPGTVISFTLVTYILRPGSTSNVGAAYFNRALNALTASTGEQHYPASAPDVFVYLPLVVKNSP